MKDKFAQMYFKDITLLFNLTIKENSLLLLMVKSIGLGNKSSIVMSPAKKKIFMKELGISTTNSISNMLRSLESKNIAKRLEPEGSPYTFTINPDLLFAGNDYQRVKIMIDYSNGKRNLRAFKNEDELLQYLHEEK